MCWHNTYTHDNRLWSLLDVIDLDFDRIATVMDKVSHMQGGLTVVQRVNGGNHAYGLIIADHEAYKKQFDELPEFLRTFELYTSAILAERFMLEFNRGETRDDIVQWVQKEALHLALRSFSEGLTAELSSKHIMFVESRKAEILNGSRPFFDETTRIAFVNVQKDIDEAEKCYALDRYTASVFHSIRCLEAGLLAMARNLSIPDPIKGAERNWNVMLRKVSDKIDEKWPTSANKFDGDGQGFEKLHASLVAMKNPYRNSTMHLDQNYDEIDARDILVLVSQFMRLASDIFDCNGEPKLEET